MLFRILTAFSIIVIGGASTSAQERKVRFTLDLRELNMAASELPKALDVAGQNVRSGTVDLIGSIEYFKSLKEQGYPVKLLEVQPQQIEKEYLTHEEINARLRKYAETYPELVHVEVIGKSLKGRDILAARISTQEYAHLKPAVLFNAMHHAREIMTPEVAMDIIDTLLGNFLNDDKPIVRAWVENLAIWVIPQVNPDGNKIVWEKDNWWRKNARGEGEQTWGVDLNRNYSHDWGACNGSSGSKSSQTYRGPTAASEPETQGLMKFFKEKNILLNVSYHSYSEMVIAPYGCSGKFTPENFVVKEVGLEFAKRLKTDDGRGSYSYGTGWELLYPVDGDDISWMYHEVNALAYVVEVNASEQGFQPRYKKWRDVTVQKQRPGWQYLLTRVLAGPQVRGKVYDSLTGKLVDVGIRVKGLPQDGEKPRVSKNGFFYKLLSEGEYEIEFSAPGYKSHVESVRIGPEPTVLEVQLEPGLDFWDNVKL